LLVSFRLSFLIVLYLEVFGVHLPQPFLLQFDKQLHRHDLAGLPFLVLHRGQQR
jgi:hypothetical protein